MSLRFVLGTGIGILLLHQIVLLAMLAVGTPPRLSILAAAVLFLVYPLLRILHAAGVPTGPALRLHRVPVAGTALGVLGFLLAVPAVLAITGRIAAIPEPVEQFFEELLRVDSGLEGVWVFFIAAVIPAVTEELMFRGYLQRALETRLGPWPAILLTAAGFGLIHGFARAPTAFALGLLMGWMTARSGSVIPAMIAHALANSAAIFLANVDPELMPANEATDVPWSAAIATGAISVALLATFARATPRNDPTPPPASAPWSPRREPESDRPGSR